jgi:glycine cleavage system aminomethyltransferase T
LLFHAEIIRRDGVELGYVRAASYGHTLGGAVGLAMLVADQPIDAKFLESGSWDVQIANTRYPITVSLKPLFDPTNSKVRG